MKKVLIIIVFFISITSCSQNERETLISDMQNYIKASNEYDFESLVEYYPEFFFYSTTKKETIAELKKYYSEESENLLVLDSEFQIDTIIRKNSDYYARIKNSQNITMDLTEFKGENGMGFAVSMMYKSLVNEHGKENVKQGKEDWIFKVSSEKPLYGLKNENENWKFIELNDETKKFIPIEIISQSEKNN